MALTTFYTPRYRAVDDNGDPIPQAVLEFFEAGTSTPLAVYADVDGNTSLGSTVTSDGSGLFAELFMQPQAYDINLYDANSVLIWSAVDWFPPQAASSANVDLTGTCGETITYGQGCYLSDGSGSKNAGQWYKWDADLSYASSLPECGFALANYTAGDTGLFRTAGKVTSLTGLVTGSLYYISGTAGAISTTPGAYGRMVGQAESATVLVTQTNPPASVDPSRIKTLCNGRLSLTTAVPVTTSDVTAATTLYWVPYLGDVVGLYSGTTWLSFALSQLSIAVPSTTNTNYDVFLDYNSGTPALALNAWRNSGQAITGATNATPIVITANSHGLSNGDQAYVSGVLGNTAANGTWTVANVAANTFELATSVGNGAYTASTGYFNARKSNGLLTKQDGVYVLTGATTKRLVGALRTTGVSGQTEDSLAKRFVWNYYNRVDTTLRRVETTVSWTYTTATIRQANASTSNQTEIVVGVPEDEVSLNLAAVFSNTNTGVVGVVGIGVNSTTLFTAGQVYGALATLSVGANTLLRSTYDAFPAPGYSFFSWNEYSAATGTSTWYGISAGFIQSGLSGRWRR